jgi:hypothetical protein
MVEVEIEELPPMGVEEAKNEEAIDLIAQKVKPLEMLLESDEEEDVGERIVAIMSSFFDFFEEPEKDTAKDPHTHAEEETSLIGAGLGQTATTVTPFGSHRSRRQGYHQACSGGGERESDEDITSIHTMNGPITRSRARQLNLQVRSTLVNCVSELTLGAMYVFMIRKLGEDQQGLGKGLAIEEEQQGRHNRKEIKSDSAATPSRVLGPVCTKMDAQDASELRLRQT